MADESGWVSLHRQIWDWRGSPIRCNKSLTKFEAWIWLVTAASYKDHYAGDIPVKRGQVLTSLEKLTGIWRRDRKTVRRWLQNMVEYGEITLEPAKMAVPASGPPSGPTACPLGSLVTICNYERYQGDGTGNGTGNGTCHGTGNGTQSIIENKRKKKNAASVPFDEWYSQNRTKAIEIAEARAGIPCSSGIGREWLETEIGKIRAWFAADPKRIKKQNARFLAGWLNNATKPIADSATGRSGLVP